MCIFETKPNRTYFVQSRCGHEGGENAFVIQSVCLHLDTHHLIHDAQTVEGNNISLCFEFWPLVDRVLSLSFSAMLPKISVMLLFFFSSKFYTQNCIFCLLFVFFANIII